MSRVKRAARAKRGWLLDVLVCAGCGGTLEPTKGPGAAALVSCERCGAVYPVLDGAPLLVASPPQYLAGYRDAVLATLATRGAASADAVAVVQGFADAGPKSEPLAFGDDWVAAEADTSTDGAQVVGAGEAHEAFVRFLGAAGDGVDDAIVAMLPERRETIVELGAGAGLLARRLAGAPGVERLLVADLSLRAALRAADRARDPRRRTAGRSSRGPGDNRRRSAARSADVAAAVLDAELLPLAARSADAIVAAELIDLLAAPERFLRSAAPALRKGGRLILATPDPSLGTGDDDRLDDLLAEEGWRVVGEQRAVPWVRAHGPRHYQVYFADVLSAVEAEG